jgi:F-type H+-transporting ATPase subunit gamma
MATLKEVKLRIRSVKNITQVTRALQAVSTSRVRRAIQAMMRTRPYASKAWQVLCHIANQPGRSDLHPLLAERAEVRNVLVVMVSGDRGLAGAYNTNIVRYALQVSRKYMQMNPSVPVSYITVGRKGRDLLLRYQQHIIAEFSKLPVMPTFTDVSAIGRLAVEEFLAGRADEVYLIYTDYINMVKQVPTLKKLLPLPVTTESERVMEFEASRHTPPAAYTYEPDQVEILDTIIPRFTALQVYHAILESNASEHAARMVAMKNATENAAELADALQLQYNKARQQSITNEMLDIAGGAEAFAQAAGRAQ